MALGELVGGLLTRVVALCVLLFAFVVTNAEAQAVTVNWVNWTDPVSYPFSNATPFYTYSNGASGTITLPSGGTVSVTLSGEVLSQSCFVSNYSTAGCPGGYWPAVGGWGVSATYPSGTFTSARVPVLPSTQSMIAQAGSVTHTLTFSQPMTNVVMNVFSLGGGGTLSAYVFDQNFNVLSQNPGCGFPLNNATTEPGCLTVSGTTLSGNEGAGTIQFPGTFSSLSWTVSVPEYFSGFTIGVTSLPAPTVTTIAPSSGSTAGGTAVTITGSNFSGVTGVTVGGAACASVTVVSATSITCTTPARSVGAASVLVATYGGTNVANALFAYVAPNTVPTLSKWSLLLFGTLMAGAMVWYQRRRV